MNMMEEWQSQEFRQNIISKITEFLQTSGQDIRNANVMENHLFKRSRNKMDYLNLVNKLFHHFKDLKRPQQPQPPNPEMQQQNPLNALENLATQGNRPQMMPMQNGVGQMGGPMASSNLLQSLSHQRGAQQMTGMRMQMPMSGSGTAMQSGNDMGAQQMGNNLGGPMAGNIQMNSINHVQQNQMVGMPQQMSQMGPNVLGNQPSGPIAPNQMAMNPSGMQPGNPGMNVQQIQQMNQNQMNMGMGSPQINQMMTARMNPIGAPLNVGPNASPQMISGMGQQMQTSTNGPMQPNSLGGPQGQVGMSNNVGLTNAPNQMINMMGPMQQRAPAPLQQNTQMFVARGMGGQQQYLRQSPSPSAGPNTAQQPPQMVQPNQAGGQGPQLPTPQMIPSPALAPAPSPQMPLIQPQQRNLRQQSPGQNLNTPGQVSQNSPFNMHEDQLYREKYKQLTKYIEPLKRMVARIGNDDAEKITKMKKLLQILCNPSERVPLETLLKCEKALEKMEPCLFTGAAQFGKSSNPLMEVLNTSLQSPLVNHTLNRTFQPSLESMFGSDICGPMFAKHVKSPPKKSDKVSSGDLEIPHVLQGEIARLDSRFKISLDNTVNNNKKSIQLVCCLDDKKLPSVPPVNVCIPEEYPRKPPRCSLPEKDYTTTPFLELVYKILMTRMATLPRVHSLSHFLDIWEMSVRQSCSPNSKNAIADFNNAFAIASS